jgi:hypothetical protein
MAAIEFTRAERAALLTMITESIGRPSPDLQSAIDKLADAEQAAQREHAAFMARWNIAREQKATATGWQP